MSKTRHFQSIRSLNLDAVASILGAHPEPKDVKDQRGRNVLHVLCSLESDERRRDQSLKLAKYLLGVGLDINVPAFVEGAFQATPLWYAISRGRNIPLATLRLESGSTPEFCLWAAAFNDDVSAIDLLIRNGASVDPVTEDETHFLGAIKWSRFVGAKQLLHPQGQDLLQPLLPSPASALIRSSLHHPSRLAIREVAERPAPSCSCPSRACGVASRR